MLAHERINIGETDRAVFVGRTGSGKTTLAKAILAQYPHVVAIDSKGDFDLPNCRVATAPHELYAMEPLAYEPIIYRPEPEFWSMGYYDSVFLWVYRRRNTTLYVDEIYGVMDGTRTPEWYRACLTRGRALNIRTISGTQRPFSIPLNVLSESEHFVMFALNMRDDKKRMAELMGEEVMFPLRDKHSFYYYEVGSGQVVEMRLEGIENGGRNDTIGTANARQQV